ncbi:histidine triad nucleotide-binding protein [Caldinitratiruptor microaerophilus]|uniref:histidine triad nucleotide-binding protein n=1 Tax=Caldinitratiruptor microaerophilus TaxID=671077 RepID=UPI003873AE7E
MNGLEDCVFCKIVRGELPASKVYEDDAVLAFRDIRPQAPVHVLVVPKKHVASLMDLTDEDAALAGRLFAAARAVARQEGVAESGFRFLTNTGPDSGQVVFHLHFHVMGGRRLGAMG